MVSLFHTVLLKKQANPVGLVGPARVLAAILAGKNALSA
jgi:hypothetical protein